MMKSELASSRGKKNDSACYFRENGIVERRGNLPLEGEDARSGPKTT